MKLDKWYKSIVEANTEAPPEAVWEGIQNALDIDLVWSKIESDLSVNKKKPIYARLAVAASIVLALALGGLLLYQPWNISSQSQLVESSVNYDETPSSELLYSDGEGAKDIHSLEGTGPNQIADVTRSTQFDAEEIDEYGVQPGKSSVDGQVDVGLERIEMLAASYVPFTLSERVAVDAIAELPVEEEDYYDKTTGLRSVYVGLTGHLANTWLLSSKTFMGLQPDDLTNTNITFASNVGVQLGAEVNPSLKLQTEFLWLSQNRQQYNEYLNGKYVTSMLELDYYTISLQTKYRLSSNHSLMLGGYFGLMKTARQSVDEAVFVLDTEYGNYDYGLILGYEYPIPFGSKFTFTPGVFAKVGLTNVFTGNELIPFYLNKTQNASVNLTFSVAYNIF